ncbi:MAG: hypothetical protein V2B18_23060 [Pseudomonadota bacterium]
MERPAKKIKSSEFLNDVRSGLGRKEIRRKYGLTEKQMAIIENKVVEHGPMDRRTLTDFLDRHQAPAAEAQVAPTKELDRPILSCDLGSIRTACSVDRRARGMR